MEAGTMSASVTLKVVDGLLNRAEYDFRKPTLCSIGRGNDCSVKLPTSFLTSTVSRHHCLLEIDPPLVRVCDMGSRNGTFVNGVPIGRREPGRLAEDVTVPTTPDYPLHDGDELRVGEVIFTVGVKGEEKKARGRSREPAGQLVG
jgi:pSer/pThr/pTyr-binding forkhead associated (FHA) protein